MSATNDILGLVSKNWAIICGAGTVIAAGLTYAFNKSAGNYDLVGHTGCISRNNQFQRLAQEIMTQNPDVKSIFLGHAENTYIYVRDEEKPERINRGIFIHNISSQAAMFHKAMCHLDAPVKILEIANKPESIQTVPKKIKKAVRSAKRDWTNNYFRRMIGPIIKSSDKRQDLANAMEKTLRSLNSETGDTVSGGRSALALRIENSDGTHLIALPAHKDIGKVLNEIYEGDADEITPQKVLDKVKERYASYYTRQEIETHQENEMT